jgi:hypothetical protein
MTILSRPVATNSHVSWDLIAGGTNNFLVQRRTMDGIEKNKGALHRATHKSTDLTQFRIIYSNIEVDFAGLGGTATITPRASSMASGRGASLATKEKETRVTVAVAELQAEIMRDWDEIKECWRRAEGVVNIQNWENFYQGIIRIRVEEAAEEAASPRASIANGSIAQEEMSIDPTRASVAATVREEEPEHFLPEPSPANDSNNASFSHVDSHIVDGHTEDTAANANHHSGCTDQEVWAARLVGAWLWTDAYQSTLMLCLFLHGYYAQWLSWWTAVVILYLSGLTLPRYHRPRFESDGSAASASLGMSGDEIRALVNAINRWQVRLGIDHPRAVQSKMASIILMNYSMSVFVPGGVTLRVLFEQAIGPFMVISLLAGALYVTLFRKKPATSDVPIAHIPRAPDPREVPVAAVVTAPSLREASPIPINPVTIAHRSAATTNTAKVSKVFSELITIPLKMHHSTNWAFKSKTDGVLFEEMESPFCNKKACRFTLNVPNSTCAALEKMLCDDPECNSKTSYAYKFDTLLSSKKLIRRINETDIVLQNMYKSPFFGIAARDMVTRFNNGVFITNREDQEALGVVPATFASSAGRKTGVVFIQSCIDHGKPNQTPVVKGYTRGAVHAYLAMGQEEDDGSLTITLTMSVDPQGSIPASIVEATNAEQVKKLQIMRGILNEIGPIRKEFPAEADDDSGGAGEENNSNPAMMAAPDALCQSTTSLDATISLPDEIDDNVRKWIDLFHNKHWQLQQNKDNVVYYLTASPWCDKKAVRVQYFVQGVKAHALDQVLGNPENATKYDRLLRTRNKLKDLTIRTCLLQNIYASPFFGIKARDFVVRSTPRTYLNRDQQVELGLVEVPCITPGAEKGNVFLNCCSNARTDAPVDPAYERGDVHCHGVMAMEEVLNGQVVGVQLIQCSSVDPCGSIPNNLVNASNAEQMEKIKIIGKLMKSIS